MLKNRSFLLGLGAGIIFGAVLFQLMLFGVQSRQNLQKIDHEKNEKLYTQDEVDAMLKAEKDSAQINEQTKGGESEPEALPSPTTAPVVKEQETVKPEATSSEKAVKETKTVVQHVLRIESGSGLTATASLLAENQIIQDQTAFIQQMKKSKKLVRAGYFLFNEGSSVAEAIKIVTSQPLTKSQANSINSSLKKD